MNLCCFPKGQSVFWLQIAVCSFLVASLGLVGIGKSEYNEFSYVTLVFTVVWGKEMALIPIMGVLSCLQNS